MDGGFIGKNPQASSAVGASGTRTREVDRHSHDQQAQTTLKLSDIASEYTENSTQRNDFDVTRSREAETAIDTTKTTSDDIVVKIGLIGDAQVSYEELILPHNLILN